MHSWYFFVLTLSAASAKPILDDSSSLGLTASTPNEQAEFEKFPLPSTNSAEQYNPDVGTESSDIAALIPSSQESIDHLPATSVDPANQDSQNASPYPVAFNDELNTLNFGAQGSAPAGKETLPSNWDYTVSRGQHQCSHSRREKRQVCSLEPICDDPEAREKYCCRTDVMPEESPKQKGCIKCQYGLYGIIQAVP